MKCGICGKEMFGQGERHWIRKYSYAFTEETYHKFCYDKSIIEKYCEDKCEDKHCEVCYPKGSEASPQKAEKKEVALYWICPKCGSHKPTSEQKGITERISGWCDKCEKVKSEPQEAEKEKEEYIPEDKDGVKYCCLCKGVIESLEKYWERPGSYPHHSHCPEKPLKKEDLVGYPKSEPEESEMQKPEREGFYNAVDALEVMAGLKKIVNGKVVPVVKPEENNLVESIVAKEMAKRKEVSDTLLDIELEKLGYKLEKIEPEESEVEEIEELSTQDVNDTNGLMLVAKCIDLLEDKLNELVRVVNRLQGKVKLLEEKNARR